MAPLATAGRLSARLVSRQLRQRVASRSFRSPAALAAAHEFTMPAMSPTMTEGNIASWKVKEGDPFAAGDVLLEIETDKAQMDVEAQDDGIMAKITQGDGSKSVKVGTRIAVLADPGDDLGTLSLPDEKQAKEPAQDSAPTTSPQEETKSGIDPSESSESQAEAPPSSKGPDTPASTTSESSDQSSSPPGKTEKQRYPLYPSVAQLLHQKGISSSEIDKIPASGPKGRLLKGDILAYLGAIGSSYAFKQSARISKLGHLDLSNITIAPPPPPPPSSEATTQVAPTTPEPEPDTEINVPISLKAVLEVQKRLQTTLGVTLPLSTFIARATELANDDLPRSSTAKPSADELFNQVLGLDKVGSKTSRGSFTPQITALPPPSAPLPRRRAVMKPLDIIDVLAGTHRSSPISSSQGRMGMGMGGPQVGIMAGSGREAATNVFSVSVPRGEEKRARVFLERVKTILQLEPGRLIL